MADPRETPEEEGLPAGFPDNVNPTKENIKAFEAQREQDQKALEAGKEPAAKPHVGEAQPAEDVAASSTRQTKTASK